MAGVFLDILQPMVAISSLLLDGMGSPAIDENLAGVLDQLDKFSRYAFQPIYGIGTAVAQIGVLCMLSWECIKMIGLNYQWSLARIGRPILVYVSISFFGSIAAIASAPGTAMERPAYNEMVKQNKRVAEKEIKVAEFSRIYLDSLQNKIDESTEKEKELLHKDQNFIEEMFSDLALDIEGESKKIVVVSQTKAIEIFNKGIRVITEFVWQAAYYGLIIVAKFAMTILMFVGPLAFGVSVFPPYANAWSKWLARWINLSFYCFLAYMAVAMIDQMFLYALSKDIAMYKGFLGGDNYGTGWADIRVLGINQIGTTTAYVAAMWAGSYALQFVPEVASWIMPAGASSGISAAAQGFKGTATGTVKAAAVGAASAPAKVAATAVGMANPVLGMAAHKVVNVAEKGTKKIAGGILDTK